MSFTITYLLIIELDLLIRVMYAGYFIWTIPSFYRREDDRLVSMFELIYYLVKMVHQKEMIHSFITQLINHLINQSVIQSVSYSFETLKNWMGWHWVQFNSIRFNSIQFSWTGRIRWNGWMDGWMDEWIPLSDKDTWTHWSIIAIELIEMYK